MKTIFKPHQLGVVALDISADFLYIVTLSKVSQSECSDNDDGGTNTEE